MRLQRMREKDAAQILVKFEGLNIGGSIKSRTAYHMICRAEEAGELHPDSIIVEPTSGNQGVGLAMVGAIRGYRTIIIMPDSVSRERSMLVRHYGAEVIFVHDAGDIGACIAQCVALAEQMARETPKSLFRSNLKIWQIPRFIALLPHRRFCVRRAVKSTDFVPVSVPAAPSAASGRFAP